MSYVRPNISAMTGYVPGEQPQGDKYIKLNTNENPYPCSPKVKAAIGRVVTAGLQRYPDPLATAFRLRAGDVLGVDPDWMLCGNGSDDCLTIITRSFVDSGDVVRYPNPSYVLYKTLAEIQGAACDVVSFDDQWALGPQFTAERDRLKLAYLANPNSPSGTVLPPERVAEIAAALPCPLVVDEAYADFAETNCLSLVPKFENVLVTRTLSKSYALAGMRFGFVIAQPALIEQLAKVKDSYNCDAVSIAAATAAIDDQEWLTANRRQILATRVRLAKALAELGFTVASSQANFVWCTREQPVEPVYQHLKENGVLTRYMQFNDWGEGLRITVGTDPQVDACLAMLKSAV